MPPKPLAELVTTAPIKVSPVGTVATKDEGEHLLLDSPHVHMTSTATLDESASADEVGGMISVGFVQELVSSNRVAVYKRADGSVFERRNLQKNKHDARYSDGANGKKVSAVGVGPWYETPGTLSALVRSTSVFMTDYPGFPVDYKEGDGTLVRTYGSDNFVTALGVQRGGPEAPVEFRESKKWSVPWATEVSDKKAKLQGTGEVKPDKTTDVPKTLKGDLPINNPDWVGYPTVDDARRAPMTQLLDNLQAARESDPESYKNMVQAITELNWQFTVSVKCVKTFKWFAEDFATVELQGHDRKNTGFWIDNNVTHSTTFRFLELFQPARWKRGQVLTINVAADGNALPPVTLSAPFSRPTFTFIDGKHYQISVTG